MEDEDLGVEVEDVEVEGSNPITKFPKYAPLCKDKTKVSKYTDKSKLALHIPLLLDKIVFEGPCLGRVPLLKLEDWDLADTKKFPHRVINQLMHCIVHTTTEMTMLESRKWLKGVD